MVKADAYGHGLLPSARAALRGGATWLGVAQLPRRIELRAAGIDRAAAVLAARARAATSPRRVDADVDLSVSAPWALDAVAAAARAPGGTARIHLKVDTGLGRNGAFGDDWPDAGRTRRRGCEAEGAVERRRGLVPLRLRRRARSTRRCAPQQERFSRRVAAGRAGRPATRRCATSPTRPPP